MKKKVGINTMVTVKDSEGKYTYTLVEPEDIDLSNNKISKNSPMGKALLGHKQMDHIKVGTPRGVRKYRIVNIK